MPGAILWSGGNEHRMPPEATWLQLRREVHVHRRPSEASLGVLGFRGFRGFRGLGVVGLGF